MKNLSERDICTKYITPAVTKAGWDLLTQIREEVSFTKGRIIVRGKLHSRGEQKRADYILYYKSNIPLAVIEAKDNNHSVGAGMQQALNYAETLNIPFVFSSNGDAFLFHDRTGLSEKTEQELSLDSFPSPSKLWDLYRKSKSINTEQERQTIETPYYDDGTNRSPRYYQANAINSVIESVAKGIDRILVVMATGTGKTYTAFQIIWRLWKSGNKKRILFLADRNILIDQTKNNDFKPFGPAMTKITKRQIDKSYEIYLSLYQAVTGNEEEKNIYKEFSADFFDLVIIDECHRGSARDDSAWRDVLEYFSSATQVGLTATPKETKDISSSHYFGDPVYTYSLKQGIEDGFLAPYKVIRIDIDRDIQGWRPASGQVDKLGQVIEDRIYNQTDMDRTLILEKRTELVAKKITDFLVATDPYAKTIVFCDDIDHAERMRKALVNLNPERARENRKYVMRITGDENEGKAELDNFINPEERYPVIATTSKLLTTGVDAQTCKLIVLDQHIRSMTEFKQIIGRGTRINEDYNKYWFTIMDFKKATELFADKDFDGDPVVIYEPGLNKSPAPPDEFTPIDNSLMDPSTDESGKVKYVIGDVTVYVMAERVQYYGAQGKLITESLKDYTKQMIKKDFASLDDFLKRWTMAEKKAAIIVELREQGVLLEPLAEEVGKDFDTFDLVCHVAFDQPPLTRLERVKQVKKGNYFAKYGDKARKVLECLLDKYADTGIEHIEDINILTLAPFNDFGTAVELVAAFGNKSGYIKAIQELERELYA
ncbi:DEAD/DEAH box helicase family protein [Candidatus Pelagibacter sp.]|nr:DEAD/DEAH box helicase family protein [Candidatus Pelagibacter sp.]